MSPKYKPFNTAPQPIGADNIGHKMLEKMGWSSGLGLGKYNQGCPDYLRTRQKHNTSGLRGRNETILDLPHQTAFDDLLGKLSSSSEELVIDPNAPLQTKIFRRTPRYKKVTTAKDVSKYGEKDLQGILGDSVSKNTCSNDSNKQGCFSETVGMCRNKPQAVCENIEDKFNNFPALEFSKMDSDFPSLNVYDQKFPTKGKRGRKKFDLGSLNANDLGFEGSVDNSTVGNWENKRRRKQFAKSNRQRIFVNEEEKESAHNVEVLSENSDTCATSTMYIESKDLVRKDNTISECEDVFANANKSGNLGNCVDISSIEYDPMSSNHIESNQSRSKVILNSDKNDCVVVSHRLSDQDSESDSSILITKPVRNHYASDDEDREWKQQILNSPALLEELCSQFVGSNLHKIKGYGNW